MSKAGKLAKVRRSSVGKLEIVPCAAGLCLGYKHISWPNIISLPNRAKHSAACVSLV